MGLFDFLKEKNYRKEATGPSEHSNEKIRNYLKDDAGLYPNEILLLSYYEKYSSGKEIARFWQYEFDVDNVPALMKSLEDRGFAKDGKLTDIGKEEAKRAEYIQYIRRHKFSDISVDSISIFVNKSPDMNYRDIIWGELNRLSAKHIQSRKYGWYRNTRYDMYQFLLEERRYGEAFPMLAEVLFYDLNGSVSPLVPPRIIENIRDISKKLDTTDKQMIKSLSKEYKDMRPPYKNFSVDEVICVFTAYAFGYDEMAEEVLKRHDVKIM